MPGWIFNVALLIDGEEALLAVGFIFTMHFFNGHLRPEKFPTDRVIFTLKDSPRWGDGLSLALQFPAGPAGRYRDTIMPAVLVRFNVADGRRAVAGENELTT
jgi:hypothetical protein